MATRSGVLGVASAVAPGWWTGFFVPANWTFIVKEVRWYGAGPTNTLARIYLVWGSFGSQFSDEAVNVGQVRATSTWIAMTGPGEFMVHNGGPGNLSWWLSGSQLPGITAQPPQIAVPTAAWGAMPSLGRPGDEDGRLAERLERWGTQLP